MSVVCVPIRDCDGIVVGVLQVKEINVSVFPLVASAQTRYSFVAISCRPLIDAAMAQVRSRPLTYPHRLVCVDYYGQRFSFLVTSAMFPTCAALRSRDSITCDGL